LLEFYVQSFHVVIHHQREYFVMYIPWVITLCCAVWFIVLVRT